MLNLHKSQTEDFETSPKPNFQFFFNWKNVCNDK